MKRIVYGYNPGIIGRIVEIHANYYSSHWGFGAFFEAKVAPGYPPSWVVSIREGTASGPS